MIKEKIGCYRFISSLLMYLPLIKKVNKKTHLWYLTNVPASLPVRDDLSNSEKLSSNTL